MIKKGKKRVFGTRREYFEVDGETFLLTSHAIDQAFERTGCSSHDIRRVVREAYIAKIFYWPSKNAKYNRDVDEFWIRLDGLTGKGTIVVNKFSGHNASLETDWTIITVRDSNDFTQAERKDEKLTHRPFAQLKRTGS